MNIGSLLPLRRAGSLRIRYAASSASSARAFVDRERVVQAYRPAEQRVRDWDEVFVDADTSAAATNVEERREQAERCMDCGTPFCQTATGCPIDNLVPEWNRHAAAGEWKEAWRALRKTNNFPEFTSRVCPAPCEGACVAGLVGDAVTIKNTEQAIVDEAWRQGWVRAQPLTTPRTGLRVAVIGSGPAGLAAADELNHMGHLVTVYEREDTIGGLLHYGIPNMKLDKGRVAERVKIMADEGVEFRTGVTVGGAGGLDAHSLRGAADAVVLAVGSTVPRDLDVAGRDGEGVHFAMEYLTKSMKSLRQRPESAASAAAATGGVASWSTEGRNAGDEGEGNALAQSKWGNTPLRADGKDVVIIGGGDTGTDCIATALRQNATSIINLEIQARPPEERDAAANPWPEWPQIFRVDYGHAEAAAVFGDDPRVFGVSVKEFERDDSGALAAVHTVAVDKQFKPLEGTEERLPCQLALLSMGFLSPEEQLLGDLSVETTRRTGTVEAAYDGDDAFATSVDGVFAAGDCRRGQSLVVWAINEGRGAAAAVQRHFESLGLVKSKASGQVASSSLQDWMGGSFFDPRT